MLSEHEQHNEDISEESQSATALAEQVFTFSDDEYIASWQKVHYLTRIWQDAVPRFDTLSNTLRAWQMCSLLLSEQDSSFRSARNRGRTSFAIVRFHSRCVCEDDRKSVEQENPLL